MASGCHAARSRHRFSSGLCIPLQSLEDQGFQPLNIESRFVTLRLESVLKGQQRIELLCQQPGLQDVGAGHGRQHG